MEGLITGILMSLVFLLFLVLLRKKYEVTLKMMVVLHILFTLTGAFGASLGAVLSGLSWAGKRLHMLMVVDSLVLTLFCKLLKIDERLLGDYLAIPVIAVCAAAKVGCVIFDCCYGITLYVDSQGIAVRFPSAIVELSIWIILVLWLLYVQRKGRAEGFLWPVALIWFGILRFLVDFLRGSLAERTLAVFGVPIGGFWSLFTLIWGVGYLICSFRKYCGRNPSVKEILRLIVGFNAKKLDQ